VTNWGTQVAVVERKYIGGSYPNIACLPSKSIIHSAKVPSYFRRSKEFGITHDGFAIDMADERKRKMVPGLNDTRCSHPGRRLGAALVVRSTRESRPRPPPRSLRDATKSLRSNRGRPVGKRARSVFGH
jgi:hypothetical protein